jgi:dTDP-4-amino-4,6-dideoxygalactose transaminase
VYHLFPILADGRDDLQRHLRENGVETLVHYPVPIPRQPALSTEDPAVCPVADGVCGRVLSLPLYPGLADTAIDSIVNAVRGFSVASATVRRVP